MDSTSKTLVIASQYKKERIIPLHFAALFVIIMKITGYKTEKNFLQYSKISQEDNANKLVNHPFFA